ncbi:MAG: TatD family hydrolase [Armatimonadota bacterium]
MTELMLFDSHAHLNHPKFNGDWQEALKRAKTEGVGAVLNVGYDIPSSERAVRQCLEAPEDAAKLFASVAVHPHDAKVWNEKVADELLKLAKHPSVVAIGEIGLDFHYDLSPRDAQFRAFAEQLEIASQLNLPVVLHIREAHKEALEIVRSFNASFCGVAHCFTGTWEEAKAWLDLGFYIGITGIVTFERKAENVKEVAAKVPLDKMLIETDAPYLAPVPYRGKRNEPAFLSFIARTISELRRASLDEVSAITCQNAIALFGLGARFVGML